MLKAWRMASIRFRAIVVGMGFVGVCALCGICSLVRLPTMAPVIVATAQSTPTVTRTAPATAIPPTETPTLVIIPAATIAPRVSATSTKPANSSEVQQAFADWLQATVCDPSDPQEWCKNMKGVSFVGDTLTARTTLSVSNRAALTTMMQNLSAFVYNNKYAKFGLKNIVVVSDSNGATLARRRGIGGKIEFP